MSPFKSILSAAAVAATSVALVASAAQAADLPNLVPGWNDKTGTVTVKNIGGGDAGRSIATVHCKAMGGGSCADPTPAQIAPYQNPAYPDRAAIKFGPVAGNSSKSHTFPFYNSLVWMPGNYILTVCVDAGKHVKESNERDNCKRFRKSVRGKPQIKRQLRTN